MHQILTDQNVWLVLERWGLQREYYDPPFQQQLLAQTDHITAAEAQGIFVLRSKKDPRPVATEPAQRVHAIFDDQVQLSGYTVEPESSRPGQPLRLTLYWQALSEMDENYTVFTHFLAPDGSTTGQRDSHPVNGTYPTSLWMTGEVVTDVYEIPIRTDAAPGAHRLEVGMYIAETGERLPTGAPDGAVVLQTVTLQ